MQIHQLKGYIQNIYLIEYEQGCLLLDGACRADYPLIADFFKNILKRPLTDLQLVVVTHMHPDHAGCAHLLRRKTGCKIASGRFTKQWYSGLSGKLAHLIDIFLANWVAKRLGRKRKFIWYPPHLKVDHMLEDGEALPSFEDWRVLYTPGHTHMDISLVNEQYRQVYIADLIVKVKGKLAPPYPVHLPQAYKRSLRRLYDLVGFTVMMAHVAPQVISHHELDKLIEISPSQAQNNRQVLANRARKLARFMPFRQR